jgi:23S rRNA pseudouridine1911/1915/1917 synthase
MPAPGERLDLLVGQAEAGCRLDRFLSELLPESRSALLKVIQAGGVSVDGSVARASLRLKEGSRVCLTVPEPPQEGPEAEAIPLEFLHVDELMAAIDKPPGMVVHPAKGNWRGTLAGAIKWHLGREGTAGLSSVGGPTRPGIVHRLDRDTSGVIVVARTEAAHKSLARQFEQRTAEKTYLAITQPAPSLDSDEIDRPIGIHPYQREKMAIRRGHATSREAVTRYEVIERFPAAALVRVRPRTGRTHQIRVHLQAIGAPVLADELYSGRSTIPPGFFGGAVDGEPLLTRQALHAASLAIDHPGHGGRVCFEAPLPGDLHKVLEALRAAG